MTETIQTLKEDIAILQEKLQKLEEQDPEMLLLRQGKIDIVDYDGKKYFRIEYTDSFADAYSWYVRKVGEDAIRPVRDVNVYAPLEELYQKEVVKQKDDYPYKKYTPQERGDQIHKEVENEIEKLQEKNWYVAEENDWKTVALLFGKKLPVIPPYGYDELSPNGWYMWVVFNYDNYIKQRDLESGYYPTPPQTPEQIEKSLREAFQKVQQTEKWKETQRKIDAPKESWMNKSDEELVAMLEKNPPDCLKFVMGKTLEQIIERWWCDTFTGTHEKWSMEECIDDLIDQIELFLPRSQSSEGTQNIDTVVAVEAHNELLQKIKSKLRNKKDT